MWQDARDWIFRSRRNAGHNADIWDLRFKWSQEQHRLFNLVTGGEYRLSPMNVIRNYAGEPVLQWSARDALVLKWVALKIKDRLPVQEACTHVAGRRGGRDDIEYVRYMDDFLFLSDRRWPVRHAQKRLYDYFDLTGFDCHPDKKQAGKISRGFDWPGVWFTDNGATGIAPRAKENHRQRCLRLYEARRAGLSDREAQKRVQQYQRRWMIWAESQLSAANFNFLEMS